MTQFGGSFPFFRSTFSMLFIYRLNRFLFWTLFFLLLRQEAAFAPLIWFNIRENFMFFSLPMRESQQQNRKIVFLLLRYRERQKRSIFLSHLNRNRSPDPTREEVAEEVFDALKIALDCKLNFVWKLIKKKLFCARICVNNQDIPIVLNCVNNLSKSASKKANKAK